MNILDRIRNRQGKIALGGHKGHASTTLRENTIENFEALASLQLPYIEVDLQLSKDGELVVFHDHDLSLQTPLQGMVREHSLGALKSAFPIHSVEELILWAKKTGQCLAFELKIHPEKMQADRMPMAEKLAALLAKHEFEEQCFVFGLDFEVLGKIKELNPKVILGIIVPYTPEDPCALMESMQADIYLNYAHLMNENLIKTLHTAGYLVNGSVVNTKEALDFALKLGVDMLESDYPAEMLAYLEKLQ